MLAPYRLPLGPASYMLMGVRQSPRSAQLSLLTGAALSFPSDDGYAGLGATCESDRES